MGTRLRRSERTEDTRRRLLDAAKRVFGRRGFHGATLDLVADEAGFTKGAVYSRFRSKADLFLALLEERIAARIAEIEAAAAAERGVTAVATALGRQWGERLQRDDQWSLPLLEFRLHAARTPALNRRYAALHARLRTAMANTIAREAAEAGDELPIAADDVARIALALGTGAILERCVDGAAFPDHLMETANRALALGLAQPASAAPAARRRRRAG